MTITPHTQELKYFINERMVLRRWMTVSNDVRRCFCCGPEFVSVTVFGCRSELSAVGNKLHISELPNTHSGSRGTLKTLKGQIRPFEVAFCEKLLFFY